MRVIGIAIDKEDDPRTRQREKIVELMRATAKRLEVDAPRPELELRDEFLGGGYGVVADAERHALKTMARHEGILLDPVYTARAFAGLLGMMRAGEFVDSEAPVIFWHTGGHPALFAPELGPLV